MTRNRLPASVLRDFTVPDSEEEISPHGSQREDAILSLYLADSGWTREASAAAKAAFLPDVPVVHEGNGRGRGATFIDGFRVNPDRAYGGDFLSLKAPKARKTGAMFTTSHDLFTGTESTLRSIIAAMKGHAHRRKAFPLVVCHTDGDTFSPNLIEWGIVNLPDLFAAPFVPAGWDSLASVAVRPSGFKAGRGGNPTPIWLSYDRVGKTDRAYWTITMSLRSIKFRSGSPADFAADVNAATSLK